MIYLSLYLTQYKENKGGYNKVLVTVAKNKSRLILRLHNYVILQLRDYGIIIKIIIQSLLLLIIL